MQEALFYERLQGNTLRCFLCAQQCRISEGKTGLCGVRQNIQGQLYSLVYGRPVAANADPVEKKPLYHFLPGTYSFSLATFGCNFRCGFCQNWRISQAHPPLDKEKEVFLPAQVVEAALKSGCLSISYTYSEPTVFFEYAFDIAVLAKEKGLANIFVTNGYMGSACLEKLRPYLDAANVDLKFFKEDSYRRVCSASLGPVLDSIRLLKEVGIWVELTTLVIPSLNDSPEELSAIAAWIAGLDKDIPWHISRFHPDYKFNNYRVTPEKTLRQAVAAGEKAGLRFVYAGNVSGWGEDTLCPRCHKTLVRRQALAVLENNIRQGRCLYCQAEIPGVWMKDA